MNIPSASSLWSYWKCTPLFGSWWRFPIMGRDGGPITPDQHSQDNQMGYAYLEEDDLFERWRRRYRYFQAWRHPKPQGLAPTAWSMIIESQSTQLSYSRVLRRSITHKVSSYYNFPSFGTDSILGGVWRTLASNRKRSAFRKISEKF